MSNQMKGEWVNGWRGAALLTVLVLLVVLLLAALLYTPSYDFWKGEITFFYFLLARTLQSPIMKYIFFYYFFFTAMEASQGQNIKKILRKRPLKSLPSSLNIYIFCTVKKTAQGCKERKKKCLLKTVPVYYKNDCSVFIKLKMLRPTHLNYRKFGISLLPFH